MSAVLQDPSAFHFDTTAMLDPIARPTSGRKPSPTPKPSNGEKKVIRRNRASYSCHNCRRRKIKCDKVHPVCGACRSTHERCVYNDNSRDGVSTSTYTESSPEEVRQGTKRRKEDRGSRESSSERTSPTSSGDTPESLKKTSIEDRLDRLTALVEALTKSKDPDQTVEETTGRQLGLRRENAGGLKLRRNSIRYTTEVIEVANLLNRPPSRPRNHDRSRGASSERVDTSPDIDLPTAEANELADPMSKMNLGYLSVQEGGRARYVGPTFWAYVSDEIDQLNGLLREQGRYRAQGYTEEEEEEDCSSQTGEELADSPMSDISEDSHVHNSFHKAGDQSHLQKSQLRGDCPACQRNFFDKSVLLQTLDSHPSRFQKMNASVIEGLPTKTQSHILFRCWLSGVHSLMPFIHPPLALKRYSSFWEWYENDRESGKPCPEIPFLPLIFAIWYSGSVSISIHGLRHWFPGTTRAKLSAQLHDQVTRWLALLAFPRNASIPSLAAFMMVQQILAKEEEPITSSLYVSLAIRVAQTLGLHRDPTLFNFAAWEVETRRRLWWQIVHNDCYVSISSGLPPVISDSYFDTKMISEIKDLKLGTPEADAYQEAIENGTRARDMPDDPVTKDRKSMVSVVYVFSRGKYVLARGIRRLLRIHMGTRPITKGDMQEMRKILNEVDHDLNEIVDRIPTKGIPEMGFTPDRDETGRPLGVADTDPALGTQPSVEEMQQFTGMAPREGLTLGTVRYHWNTLVAFHKWARIVLSMLVDKLYCVFYAPFLKTARSKFWASARACALRHCHSFMRKFISLATDPAFQPFQWAWPGMHQPMHATMILLVDLYERPNAVEAPRSRAFIDKIFSISSPGGGIVSGEDGVTVQRPLREGGREAWDMLRRLREKAWQKAGLDPTVLWTEEDQIKAGVAEPLTDGQKVAQSLRESTFHDSKSGDSSSAIYSQCLEAAKGKVEEHKETAPSDNASKTDRPKKLQRLNTQQKAPFRSTGERRASQNPTNGLDPKKTEETSFPTPNSLLTPSHGESNLPIPTSQPHNPLYYPPSSTSYVPASRSTDGIRHPLSSFPTQPAGGMYPSIQDPYHPQAGVGSHQIHPHQPPDQPPTTSTPDVSSGALLDFGTILPPPRVAQPILPPHPSSSSADDAATAAAEEHFRLMRQQQQEQLGQHHRSGGGEQDPDQHFDWDQWDAVFGHGALPGFEDVVMEVDEEEGW